MTVFLAENGQVFGCGYNAQGTIGMEHTDVCIHGAMTIEWFMKNCVGIKDVEMGEYHVIALDDKNYIYCWGCNNQGQCAVDPDLFHKVCTT